MGYRYGVWCLLRTDGYRALFRDFSDFNQKRLKIIEQQAQDSSLFKNKNSANTEESRKTRCLFPYFPW